MPSVSGSQRHARAASRGATGVPTSPSASGGPSARTTASTATPGRTSATTRRARAPIAGERTGSPASPTRARTSASRIALWNGHDPILKERLFGLTNREGNHGEDVKEYYFYLDATPTHSYLRYLYKYPQSAYPYDDLVATNRGRGRNEHEYELLDTGVFDDDRYFDVFVEYAKAAPDDIAHPDHGLEPRTRAGDPPPAADAVVPQYWSWGGDAPRPVLAPSGIARRCRHRRLPSRGRRRLLLLRPARRASLHRERDEHRTPGRRTQPHAVRQGCLRRLPRPRPPRGRQPGRRSARRPPRTTTSPSSAGESQVVRLRLVATGRLGRASTAGARPRPRSMPSSSDGGSRPTISTPR